MQTRLFALTLGLVLSVSAFNAHAVAGFGYYAVTRVNGTDTLYLRQLPASNGRVIGNIPFNAVRVQNMGERKAGWCKVKFAQTTGWASCNHLTESDGNRYYATHGYTDRLNIRRSPSMQAAVTGTIPPEETGLQGTGECSATWCPIDYQGKRGWVGRRFLGSWSP